MRIALLTPDTTQSLIELHEYLDNLPADTTLLIPDAEKTVKIIADAATKRHINYETISINGSGERWKKCIEQMVTNVDEVVMFVTPGKRKTDRQAATGAQSYAAYIAETVQMKPITRIAVKDDQSEVLTHDELPHIPIPAMPKFPRHWTNKQTPHPCHTRNWKRKHLYPPLRLILKQYGFTWKEDIPLSDDCTDFVATQNDTVLIIRCLSSLRKIHAAFQRLENDEIAYIKTTANASTQKIFRVAAIPDHSIDFIAPLQTPEAYLKTHAMRYLYLTLPNDDVDMLKDYHGWLSLPTSRTYREQRLYTLDEYSRSEFDPYDTTTKQWEIEYMYPIITEWLKVKGYHHEPQNYLAKKRPDFIAWDQDKKTYIIECKRTPYFPDLQDGVNQLLEYQKLYQQLYRNSATHGIVLILVIPQEASTPEVRKALAETNVQLMEIPCGCTQVEMLKQSSHRNRIDQIIRNIEAYIRQAEY